MKNPHSELCILLNQHFEIFTVFKCADFGGLNRHPGKNLLIYYKYWKKWLTLKEKYTDVQLADYLIEYLKNNYKDYVKNIHVIFVIENNLAPLKFTVDFSYSFDDKGIPNFNYKTIK